MTGNRQDAVTQQVLGIVRRQFAEQARNGSFRPTPASHFQIDFSADSLDYLELVLVVEDEYGIRITDEQMDSLTTVQSLIDIVLKELHPA